jgi:DNA-nicking Smr family endonuclease
MADEKPKSNPDKKQTAKKAGAAKKAKPKKAAAKKASKAKPKAKKAAPKKATPKKDSSAKAKSGGKKSARPTVGLDKSIAQFRDSLEHSVTLSRERIQEVVDDAVQRGRMTHGDAEKMIGELLKRGRKQTDSLLSELEKLVRQARRKLP